MKQEHTYRAKGALHRLRSADISRLQMGEGERWIFGADDLAGDRGEAGRVFGS